VCNWKKAATENINRYIGFSMKNIRDLAGGGISVKSPFSIEPRIMARMN